MKTGFGYAIIARACRSKRAVVPTNPSDFLYFWYGAGAAVLLVLLCAAINFLASNCFDKIIKGG